MSKKHIIDSNAIMNYPDFVIKFDNPVIPYIVLSELDRIKQEQNERGYKARQAVRKLRELGDKVEYMLDDIPMLANSTFPVLNNDDKILQIAKRQNAVVVTGDFLMLLKAKAQGLEVVEVEANGIEKYDGYTGYKEVILNDEGIAYLYENQNDNTYNLFTNQYLIVKNTSNEIVDLLRWDGRQLCHLKLPNIKKFKPINDLQACAMDLLYNKDIPIKIIAGNYGSGKTLLSVKVALHQVLDKGTYSKIMIVRNPIGTGEEIGWLKGSKEDKTAGFFKPIIQHLEGGEQEAGYMEQRGQLLKEIPFYMKGLSIDDTFIISDESEDLDVKIIKLIGTRLGKNSCIAFAGDYGQAESKYMNNNGLIKAIESLKGNPLVGVVVLEEDVRSDASKVFADL